MQGKSSNLITETILWSFCFFLMAGDQVWDSSREVHIDRFRTFSGNGCIPEFGIRIFTPHRGLSQPPQWRLSKLLRLFPPPRPAEGPHRPGLADRCSGAADAQGGPLQPKMAQNQRMLGQKPRNWVSLTVSSASDICRSP